MLQVSAVAISRLGNGGIYFVLAIFMFFRLGRGAINVIAVAACHITALHAVYPSLKRWVARRRPYAIDRNLPCLLAVLDEHSFPSGHVMTLAAALVPLVYVDPASTNYGAGLLVVMAWGRVASSHHYPSDVLAGALIAVATGYPIADAWFGRP